jgi:hypothetical protein
MQGRVNCDGSVTVDHTQAMSEAFFADFVNVIRKHYPSQGNNDGQKDSER